MDDVTSKSRRQRWIVGGCALLLLSCSFCSYLSFAYVAGEKLTCWEALNLPTFVLEDHAHFTFPPSAQAIEKIEASGSSFCVLGVKFEMQPDELDRFIATTQVEAVASTTPIDVLVNNYDRYMQQLGVNPRNVKSYLFGYTNADYFNQQYVFVDINDGRIYTVYVLADQGFLD